MVLLSAPVYGAVGYLLMSNIKFVAEVNKVQTLADNGIRVTLDLPEQSIEQMAMLAECKRQGIVLEFVATAHEVDKSLQNDRRMEAQP